MTQEKPQAAEEAEEVTPAQHHHLAHISGHWAALNVLHKKKYEKVTIIILSCNFYVTVIMCYIYINSC